METESVTGYHYECWSQVAPGLGARAAGGAVHGAAEAGPVLHLGLH